MGLALGLGGLLGLAGLAGLMATGCDRSTGDAPTTSAAATAPGSEVAAAVSATSPVHVLVMPHDEPDLPPGRGRDAFVQSCVVCHSPRYVTNQPRFSREVWTEEVQKMVKVFGAPVPAERVPEIVDYLVAFHGEEEAR